MNVLRSLGELVVELFKSIGFAVLVCGTLVAAALTIVAACDAIAWLLN